MDCLDSSLLTVDVSELDDEYAPDRGLIIPSGELRNYRAYTEHDSDLGYFFCLACPYRQKAFKTPTQYLIKRHLATFHSANQLVLCDCGKQFKNKISMRNHKAKYCKAPNK